MNEPSAPKIRLRLMKIRDLTNGTRFWYAKGVWKWSPCTLVTLKRNGDGIVHNGHEFNMTAARFHTPGWRSVWVEVKPQKETP